jgi:hypothetical protein
VSGSNAHTATPANGVDTGIASPVSVAGADAPDGAPPSESTRVHRPRPQLMSPTQIAVMGWAMVVVPLLLLSQLVAIWPSAVSATKGTAQPTTTWLFGVAHMGLDPDAALLLLVALVGATASLGEETFRFVTHAGRGDLSRRWTWFYALRPIQGAVLAVVVYFALRGGLLGTDSSTPLNPYGLAAIAGLVGLFTRQAFQKMEKVFNTLWGVTAIDAGIEPAVDPKTAANNANEPARSEVVAR